MVELIPLLGGIETPICRQTGKNQKWSTLGFAVSIAVAIPSLNESGFADLSFNLSLAEDCHKNIYFYNHENLKKPT